MSKYIEWVIFSFIGAGITTALYGNYIVGLGLLVVAILTFIIKFRF